MITSVIVFASLTAALTSQYTLKHLRGPVNGKADLQYARMGAIAGTETTEYLGASTSLIRPSQTMRFRSRSSAASVECEKF
jgi:hypothetical protein